MMDTAARNLRTTVIVVLSLVLVLCVVRELLVGVVSTGGQGGLAIANTPALVSINMPIYVVGPSTLTQRLVSAGINQSLIKPVTINQLPELPNNSIIIIDWSVIKPYLIINDPDSEVKINLTSPVIRDFVLAFGRGDVVGIYANASDESVVEFILAYSWARAVGNELVLVGNGFREVLPDYLMAYPVIPVSIHEQVIFIAKPV
ncbi:MAG: hypothetical protein ACP5NQ_09720 [Vulcanisaeta sp.]